MDTKAFVQDSISRSLEKYLELHPNIPDGGTTGQALVKTSDADTEVGWADVMTQEAFDNRTLTPSGWGVARQGIVSVEFSRTSKWSGSTLIDVTDLGFTSAADYEVLVQPTTGGTSSRWGDTIAFVQADKGATSFRVAVYSVEIEMTGTVNVKYVIFAKGYGGTHFADGTGIPTGGTSEQILAKVGSEDGVTTWVDDTGRDLVKYEREYGSLVMEQVVTQRIAKYEKEEVRYDIFGNPFHERQYSVPAQGLFLTEEGFFNGILNTFDTYYRSEGFSGERKIIRFTEADDGGDGGDERLCTHREDGARSDTLMIFVGGRRPIEIRDGNLYFWVMHIDHGRMYSTELGRVTGLRFVAKGGNNFGMSDGTEPHIIRNLTGMVLDDLKVTGNAVPTDWGIAEIGKVLVEFNNNKWSSSATIDVSGFGFASGDDYEVLAQPVTGGTATPWGSSISFVQADKSATSFRLSAYTMEMTLNGTLNVKYTIIARGFGNVTMGVNGNIPSGGSAGHVLAKKSDADLDVEWREGGGINFEVGAEKWYGTYTEEGVIYQVYSKIIKIDALPSTAGITTYDHGITGIKQILQVYGFCTNGFVMNASRQTLQDNISIYQVSKSATNQTFSIEVGKDRSSVGAYVCLVYAKNNS